MPEHDYTDLDRRIRERFQAESPLIDKLLASDGLRRNEAKALTLLAKVAAQGVARVVARRPKSADEIHQLVAAFVADGAVAALRVGRQRGGDFLNNQLRGPWAEAAALSMELPSTIIRQFGPSGAAMPGEESHQAVILAF